MADPPHETDTLLSRLLRHREERADAVFAHFVQDEGERAVAWRDLFATAVRLASFLESSGVEPRETVFILAPLGPELLGAFLGAMLARALPALLSYPSSKVAPEVYSRNLRGILEVTGARTVLTTRALEGPLGTALRDAAGKKLLWLEDARPTEDRATRKLANAIPEVSPDEVAFLQHSSGSTGLQKGVALSHRSVLNQVRHYAKAIALDPAKDKVASWLPLYHDMGLIATFLMPLATGTPVVFMDPFRWVVDPGILLEAIDRHRATLCWLPNFAYVHMAKRVPEEKTARLDLSSIRGFVNCSEPVREASHRAFLERFAGNGVREDMLWVSYAMAENTFAVTQAGGVFPRRTDWIDPATLASERRAAPAAQGLAVVSCGLPIEGCEIKVVDEQRASVADRTIGEVALRSDSMLTEYHNNAEATAKSMAEGFYFTGDLGYLADGHLYITGRKKDLIIVGGRNFYPQDLEDVASEQEGVVPGRAVAFGVENAALGTEEVVLVAETDTDDSSRRSAIKRAIQRAALERLDCAVGRVELVPRGWIIKTSSGKVARKANVEKWQSENALDRAALEREAQKKTPQPGRAAPPEPLPLLALKVVLVVLILALAVILRPNQALILYQGF
ncbi:MAG TPA: AMP-binding protein [Planctomycetota bacterium]|nr:AMP-binding protein [Planctomycetota bacterium]